MAYRAALLGCGGRGVAHVQAYEGLTEARLVAACDRIRDRVDKYRQRFTIPKYYASLEEMLDRERPDILNMATMPQDREAPMELAGRYGVRGILVEKPIALTPTQGKEVVAVARKYGLKVAVNMQRRYFPHCQELRKLIDDGVIGELVFVRATTKGNVLSMGPHVMDLILYYLHDVAPTQVWACAYGMNGYDYSHPAPANMLIHLTFPNNTVVYLEDGVDAVGTWGETSFWQHLELDLWGSRGRAWWKQNISWGYQSETMAAPRVEAISWERSDVPGQREFTRAMTQWLDDASKVHLNCLENSMRGFDAIMAALQSAFDGRRLALPARVDDDIMQKLEARIR